LAVMAALGIRSVERNGHHYHPGLSQYPKPIQDTVLQHHADFYERAAGGWPSVRVSKGELDLRSINRAPFGVGFDFDVSAFSATD
jgi:hypothetical protein